MPGSFMDWNAMYARVHPRGWLGGMDARESGLNLRPWRTWVSMIPEVSPGAAEEQGSTEQPEEAHYLRKAENRAHAFPSGRPR